MTLSHDYMRGVAQRRLRSLVRRSGTASALPLRAFANCTGSCSSRWPVNGSARGRAPLRFRQAEAVVRLSAARHGRESRVADGVTVVKADGASPWYDNRQRCPASRIRGRSRTRDREQESVSRTRLAREWLRRNPISHSR